ncbi:hypothetical protein BD413DRAFT_579106 [Trametes elegans]|nr:hypothetical protein BD413DRAFT_579106 [Trametes elegans]
MCCDISLWLKHTVPARVRSCWLRILNQWDCDGGERVRRLAIVPPSSSIWPLLPLSSLVSAHSASLFVHRDHHGGRGWPVSAMQFSLMRMRMLAGFVARFARFWATSLPEPKTWTSSLARMRPRDPSMSSNMPACRQLLQLRVAISRAYAYLVGSRSVGRWRRRVWLALGGCIKRTAQAIYKVSEVSVSSFSMCHRPPESPASAPPSQAPTCLSSVKKIHPRTSHKHAFCYDCTS